MENTKEVLKNREMEKIRKALREAKAKGFTIIVASDEEGNNWNEINPEVLFFGDTKEKFIALSVWRHIDEDEAFNAFELCEGCGEELLENQAISGDRHSACS
jgi:hypothetical protein